MDKEKLVKLLEFLPAVGLILVILKYVDLIQGTVIVMALSTFFVVVAKLLQVPLSKMQFGTWVAIVFFGGLTLGLRDEQFIKLKTTVINLVIASILGGSHILGEKTVLERLVGEHLNAPAEKLRRVNFAAVIYCLAIAALNLWVSYQFSNENWAMFKVVGIFILNMTCVGGALYYLREYLKDYIERMEKR